MFSGIWLKLLAGLAALGGVMATLFMARKGGADAQKAKQAEATAEAATSRARTDDEVRRHSDAEQVEDLERWERR